MDYAPVTGANRATLGAVIARGEQRLAERRNIVDQLVNIATTPETSDVVADLIASRGGIDKLAAFAEADRLYAELMRAHDALVSAAPLDLPAAA